MKNSQLIKLLKTFNPKDIIKFSEFITSPFFNKNTNVIKLYDAIRKAYPNFEQEKLTKENLFSSIFPGRKFNDNTLRLLIHYLYEKAKEFITHSRLRKETFRYTEVLLNELLDRQLYNESGKTLKKVIFELGKSDYKDAEYFQYKFVMEYEKLYYFQKIHQSKYEKYFTKSNIETPFKNLTNYFFLKVLTFYSIVLNTKILYNIDIDTVLFEKLFSNFDYELFNDSPLIQIYYNIILVLTTDEEKYFYTIKELMLKHEKSLVPMRLYDIYINLENYCRRNIRAGVIKFKREFFEIMKLDLEKKIYKVEPYMSQNFYKNILQNAAELKEFEWANNFIESYKDELRADYREAVYCYCKAFIEAEKNNFEKSLDYLSTLKTDELYLKIDVKLLQARLYYELNEYDGLNSAIDTTRHFLKSNKFIAENRRVQFSTFIKFLSALNNARLKKDEYKTKELKENILKAEELQWKDWFVKKVEELEGNK